MKSNAYGPSADRPTGYTIVEVLVGVVVLSLAIIPMYHIFTASSKAVFRSRVSYMALQAARDTLEELRQVPFEKLPEVAQEFANWKRLEGSVFRLTMTHRNTDDEKLEGDDWEYPEEYKRIKLRMTIKPIDGDSWETAGLAQVDLWVMWEETGDDPERNQREMRVARTRLATIIGRYGPEK